MSMKQPDSLHSLDHEQFSALCEQLSERILAVIQDFDEETSLDDAALRSVVCATLVPFIVAETSELGPEDARAYMHEMIDDYLWAVNDRGTEVLN